MKTFLRSCVAALAACVMTVVALAAEVSPTGTWKWEAGRGGQNLDQTLKLDLTNGKLTGTLLGTKVGEMSFPDTPISDASFKDGTIKFAVTREAGGRSVTTKYEGKVEGDSIEGHSERPNLQGGEPMKREWNAKRVK